jgi:hypothetical protein
VVGLIEWRRLKAVGQAPQPAPLVIDGQAAITGCEQL